MEEVEPEVEEAPRDRLAVDLNVLLHQVPAPGPNQEGRDRVIQPIGAPVGADELDRPVHGVDQVHLALDHVAPGRRVGVLEVGHEHVRPRVEGVDDHLPLGGPRDLDPAPLAILRGGRDPPLALPDVTRGPEKVWQDVRVELGLPLRPPPEQGRALGSALALDPPHEGERLGRQDLLKPPLDGGAHLDAVTASHCGTS